MISIPLRRILVPTDMSDFATLALQYRRARCANPFRRSSSA